MKKIIFPLIVAIVIFLIVIGVIYLMTSNKDSQQIRGDNNAPNNLPIAFEPIIDSQNSVDAAVENIAKEEGQTIIELSFNNHRYDLSSMNAIDKSSLSGISPLSYNILNSAMGGHHVQAEMVFDGDLSGELIVGLGESLIFKFDI